MSGPKRIDEVAFQIPADGRRRWIIMARRYGKPAFDSRDPDGRVRDQLRRPERCVHELFVVFDTLDAANHYAEAVAGEVASARRYEREFGDDETQA
jgi:hypothetical protein